MPSPSCLFDWTGEGRGRLRKRGAEYEAPKCLRRSSWLDNNNITATLNVGQPSPLVHSVQHGYWQDDQRHTASAIDRMRQRRANSRRHALAASGERLLHLIACMYM